MIEGVQAAVPARRKEEFEAEAVSAVGVDEGLVGEEVAVEARLVRRHVVMEAVKSNSTLLKRELGEEGGVAEDDGLVRIRDRLREVALEGVAGDHLEAVREGGDVGAMEEVVGKHAADLPHTLNCAVAVHEHEGRSPIGRLILRCAAGSALGFQQRVRRRVPGEP